MNDKLKFKNEEARDEVTEAAKTEEKPPLKKKRLVITDDAPLDGEAPNDDPAAEHDGGGENPEADASETDGVIADEPADPVQSKLYERESSLKFTKKPAKPVTPEAKPIKKQKKALGVTGDHSTHDNLINKPVIPVVPPVISSSAVTTGKLKKPKKPVKTANKLKFSDGEKPKTKEDKAKRREAKRAAKQDDKISDLQYTVDMNAFSLLEPNILIADLPLHSLRYQAVYISSLPCLAWRVLS